MNNPKLEQVIESIVKQTIEKEVNWIPLSPIPSEISPFIDAKLAMHINMSQAYFFDKNGQVIITSSSSKNNSYFLVIVDKSTKDFSKFILDFPTYSRLMHHISRIEDSKNKMLDIFLK